VVDVTNLVPVAAGRRRAVIYHQMMRLSTGERESG
jgi:hypothetical protein